MAATPRDPFTNKLLETFRERAAGYDADNRFFADDLVHLGMAGSPSWCDLSGASPRTPPRRRLA